MNNQENGFVKGRVKSLKYAFKGLWLLISTEHSIMVQTAIAIFMAIFGWWLDISATEWILQILAIGLVLVAESLNTAIEKICDFIHPDYNERIGFIKDISAGAVTFAAITAIIIGLIIYLPKFL
ncbi:diacylglycerol kinase family protein [Lutimonas halocynthiae]|uniref:diacylglycerol kinase family protein n=1 Tax=Lutimonas halocynthiae TaxID=1446477 RepID=UPI0025B36C19|nr:diacylglycerol kinase family protein [Lutimonas halocynthiae]MDN3643438.1 diacylglycerol kinase family protein [Lutimonas halocynthiae]